MLHCRIKNLFNKSAACMFQRLLCAIGFAKFIPLSELQAMTGGRGKVHLVFSGESAEKTVDLATKDERVIACGMGIRYLDSVDVLFFEDIVNSPVSSELRSALSSKEVGLLIKKNSYPHRLGVGFSDWRSLRREHRLFALPEWQVPACKVHQEIEHFLWKLHKSETDQEKLPCIPQYASSVMTLVLFAVVLGFKDIVLHGVDFGHVQKGSLVRHQTELFDPPFSQVLNFLISALRDMGVSVHHAREVRL